MKLFLVLLAALMAPFSLHAKQLPLHGIVLVIDPGHGGADPGAHGMFRGQMVFEAPYVNDVAQRLAKVAKAQGAIVYLTRRDLEVLAPLDHPPQKVIAFRRKDVFAFNAKPVRARTAGMKPRLAMAKRALGKHGKHIVVFMSLHFDNVGGESMVGAHFVAPPDHMPRIVSLLKDEFGKAKLLRTREGKPHWPVVKSGDKAHGMRNLYILRKDQNPVRERVLVELGNFGSSADVWRLRNPEIRDRYVRIMLAALARLKHK